MQIDVALVPRRAQAWGPAVCVVVDQLRASSTLTTLLDLGCAELLVTSGLQEARRLARIRGSLLAGERNGRTPTGFDVNNSPVELSRMGVGGRDVVLCTTNGTRVLNRLRGMPMVLVGCLLNARACGAAALRHAGDLGVDVGIVCAARRERIALDDVVAAGVIVARLIEITEAQGRSYDLTDEARLAAAVAAAYADPIVPLRESRSGRLLHDLGADEDVEWCARVDGSDSVPVLRAGPPLRIERLGAA